MSCGQPHATPCTEILSFIDIFVDGEADETRRLTITAHLVECGPCAAQVAVIRDYKAVVRRAAPQSAPQGLQSRIVASLQQVTVVYGQVEVAEGKPDA